MKIRRLRLAAYGPFTDVTLDLPDTKPDLHLIYGPNEAGKSATLRALRHMLFGIPIRCADNFLHRYADLRIGARLVHSDGATIDFVRRKGQAKTLRDEADEAVLADDALSAFLGGVDGRVFQQMFAIGHDDLIRGGEEIVSGKGQVGEALFAAGAGLIRLQNLQQGLEQDCGALFKPGGSTPAINRTIARLKAVRKDQRSAQLQAKTWQAHDRRLRDAQDRMKILRDQLAESQRRHGKLQRLRDALPLIAQIREVEASLSAFRDVPHLSDDFGEKRREAEREAKIATRDLARSRQAIAAIHKRLDALGVPEPLLRHGTAIESLQHDLGSFRKAQKDRPGLEGRMHTLRRQAKDTLARIEITVSAGDDPILDMPVTTVGEIQNLAKAFERRTAKLESAKALVRKLDARHERLSDRRRSLPPPLATDRLEVALETALAAGPIERRLNEKNDAVRRLTEEVRRMGRRLDPWSGSVDRLMELALPSRETIDRFEKRLDRSLRTMERHRENEGRETQEKIRLEAEITAMVHFREVPTEGDLAEARGQRDQGWRLVRQALAGHPPPQSAVTEYTARIDPAASLAEAYETDVARSDKIADRLRQEADRISRLAALTARLDRQDRLLAEVKDQLASASVHHQEQAQRWKDKWAPSGIDPASPAEMRAWLSDVAAIREKQDTLHVTQSRCRALAEEVETVRADLTKALETLGSVPEAPHLAQLVKTAKIQVERQNQRRQAIASAEQELHRLAEERAAERTTAAQLEAALVSWRAQWEREMRKLGLPVEMSTSAALAVIDTIRGAEKKMEAADILRQRIHGIDQDATTFQDRVRRLVAIVAPDLCDVPLDLSAERLYGRLTAARKADSTRNGLQDQLAAARAEQKDAHARAARWQAQLASLCGEAGCEEAGRLVEIEKQARERDRWIRTRDDLGDQLRRLSGGATIDRFIAAAESEDADAIEPEMAELEKRILRLEAERSEIDQTIGTEMAERNRMDGSAAAIGHAQMAESLLADLESDAIQYARLKLASVLLARTVEQYREKHQGPLIARASALFCRMTKGAFARLCAEYDPSGNPVIVGVRSGNGAQVGVVGMSDGTADQLYLALRLASLEQYLANNEPLPFVVDDILLRFDDDRALATLEVLSALAKKTQVLFFTHHRHLLDLAENATGSAMGFTVHRLAGNGAEPAPDG